MSKIGVASSKVACSKVVVSNLNRRYRVNGPLVKKIVSGVLKYCSVRKATTLEVVFLSDKQIRPFNKTYKGRDRATDVLSFDLTDTPPDREDRFVGEILISVDKAAKNRIAFKTSLEKEFTLYIIHGILHLIGYDDESAKARERMEKKQAQILRYLCKREDLSKVLTPR